MEELCFPLKPFCHNHLPSYSSQKSGSHSYFFPFVFLPFPVHQEALSVIFPQYTPRILPLLNPLPAPLPRLQYNFIQASFFLSPLLFLAVTLNLIWKEKAQLSQLENTCKLLIVVNHVRADRCMIQQVALKSVKMQEHRSQEKSSPKCQAPVWICARG